MRFVLAVAALATAALAAVCLAPEPAEAARGDALAGAVKSARKSFRRDLRTAERTFADAVRGLGTSLQRGGRSTEEAATDFGATLSFYVATVSARADAAQDEVSDAAVAAMAEAGDPVLRGAVPGDGGSLDAFAADMRKELERLRGRAERTVRRFAADVARHGDSREEANVLLPPWVFELRVAPTPTGPVSAGQRPPRLWAAAATRLQDGRVVVTAAGAADPDLDGEFDLRLRGRIVRAVGEFLDDGGMAVDAAGHFGVTDVLGDPFSGDGVDTGNRTLQFGVEPEDTGPAGIQPKRLVQAGVLGVP